jgi:hypothetical protein
MQTGDVRSLKECFIKTYRADGFRGFFKGMSSPLCSVPFVNAIVFTAYAHANTLFEIENAFWKGIVSGSYAGLVNTVVVTPVELVKIKMQIQSNDPSLGHGKAYSSAFDCVRHVVRDEGVRGLFKGTVVTIYREIPGYAMQFASFEATKSFFHSFFELEELSKVHVFCAGVVGGFNCWFWSYPQDVVKTKIQSVKRIVNTWDGGFWQISRSIWRTQGWMGFWRGFSACFLRATIPNGFGFLTNDMVMNVLTNYYE